MGTLILAALAPLRTPFLILLALSALLLGVYSYGKHVAREEYEAAALVKRVQDLAIINIISQADNEKLVAQTNQIEALKKEIENGRTKIQNKDHTCFEPADTDELRKLWR